MPDPRPLGNGAKHVIENDYEQDYKDIEDGLRVAEIAATLGNAELARIGTRIALRNADLVVASGAVLADDLKRAQDKVFDMAARDRKEGKAS